MTTCREEKKRSFAERLDTPRGDRDFAARTASTLGPEEGKPKTMQLKLNGARQAPAVARNEDHEKEH